MHVIATNETRTLLNLPYHQYVTWYVFNGKSLLWKQSDLDNLQSYNMMNTDDPAGKEALTPALKRAREFGTLAIGDQYAAWEDNKDGIGQVTGVDLTNGQTFQLTNGSKD